MTLEEKQETLADILDCEASALRPETELASLSWDSMARVSLIALVRTRFGRKVSGDELKAFVTVGDIFRIMEG